MFVYTHRRFTFHFFRSSSTLTCLMCVFVSLSLVNAAYILFLTVKLKKEKKKERREQKTVSCLRVASTQQYAHTFVLFFPALLQWLEKVCIYIGACQRNMSKETNKFSKILQEKKKKYLESKKKSNSYRKQKLKCIIQD